MINKYAAALVAGGGLVINSCFQFVLSRLSCMNLNLVFCWFDMDRLTRITF